jgi:hypothetical protein
VVPEPGGSVPGATESEGSDLAGRVRGVLMTKTRAIENAIMADAMRVQKVAFEDRSENPYVFSSREPSELLRALAYMEEQTKPFAEALAAVVRYDDAKSLWGSVVESVNLIAEEPSLTGTHWQYAQQLRLYPLVLTLHSLAFVSAARNDERLLRRVLDVELRVANREEPEPLIVSLRALRATRDLFNAALGQRYYEPIAERIFGIVPGWCSDIALTRPPEDVFSLAEFGLALEHTKVRTLFRGTGVPFVGRFAYVYGANRALGSALRTHSKFLSDLFGDDLKQRLVDFDANAPRVIEGGFRRGFTGGALALWEGDEPESH